MLKKILSILSLSLILCTPLSVQASESNNQILDSNITCIDDDCNSEIMPIYEIECASSPDGKHHMFARGAGWLEDKSGKTIINNGYAYQCKYCTTVAITEYDAVAGSKIGYYAITDPGYTTSINGTFLRTNNYSYTSKRLIPGFIFQYNR